MRRESAFEREREDREMEVRFGWVKEAGGGFFCRGSRRVGAVASLPAVNR